MGMTGVSANLSASQVDLLAGGGPRPNVPPNLQDPELREKFEEFVGTVFFGQFMKALRSTVGKPAYFHGGQAEEIFQGQLDQTLIEQVAGSGRGNFGSVLFERFANGISPQSIRYQRDSDEMSKRSFQAQI